MKIIAYADLGNKDSLLPLMDNAFDWVLSPAKFEELIRIDPRLEGGPIGFCGCENGLIVGFVGVMHLRTRTMRGDELDTGGIYGVTTLPVYTRKGICTTLLNFAQEYFRDKGYRFSFLTTSRSLVAYSLYKELGYLEFLESPHAYKLVTRSGVCSVPSHGLTEADLDRILRIYDQYVKAKSGLVIRDKPHMLMLEKSEESSLRCIVEDDGYLIFKKEKKPKQPESVWIKELVALNANIMRKLLRFAESQSNDVVYDRNVMDRSLFKLYRSENYTVQSKSNVVIMVKPLGIGLSAKQVYGDHFFVAGMDFPKK